MKEGRDRYIRSLRYTFQARSYNIMAFVSSYLAIWALTGIILLVGWSFLFDTLLLQLGINDSLQTRQQQQLSINTIYAIV